MNSELIDHKDISEEELIKMMQGLVKEGYTVFVKFTCIYCFSRQTSDTPNIFHKGGYYCEECGGLNHPDKYGIMVMKMM